MNNATMKFSGDQLRGIEIVLVDRSSDLPRRPVQAAAPHLPAPSGQLSMALESPRESFPWNDAHPKLKEQFTMRLPQALHMKLKYVAEHSPESMHDIALAAVSAAVEKRLREMDIKG